MINQNQWRNCLLIITSTSINLAAIYTFLIPTAGNRQAAEFEFPSGFNTLQGVAMAENIADKQPAKTIKARQQYQYQHNERNISIEISYLVGTRGDVATYLQKHTDINEQAIKAKSIKQIEGIGHHALLKDSQKAYLSSCISPRSQSNVTQQQFSQYRYENDLNWETAWEWLQGKASIRDRRCLWVLLATPATADDIQADYRLLETAWEDIYRWWMPKFPSLVSSN